MAKKTRKVKAPPKKLSLKRYTDFDLEAEKYGLERVEVEVVAKQVEREAEPTLSVSKTVRESELKERFEEIYSENVRRLKECTWTGCSHKYGDIHDFVAHERMHLVRECPDHRVRAAVLKDIEKLLVATVEKSSELDGALSADERARIVGVLAERKMLPKEIKH